MPRPSTLAVAGRRGADGTVVAVAKSRFFYCTGVRADARSHETGAVAKGETVAAAAEAGRPRPHAAGPGGVDEKQWVLQGPLGPNSPPPLSTLGRGGVHVSCAVGGAGARLGGGVKSGCDPGAYGRRACEPAAGAATPAEGDGRAGPKPLQPRGVCGRARGLQASEGGGKRERPAGFGREGKKNDTKGYASLQQL